MKKEDFMKIVRGRAKATLTEQEESYFGSIGEALETAVSLESVERNKKFDELSAKLGEVEDGKTMSAVIRTLAEKLDNVEAKSKRSLSVREKYVLRTALEGKKDEMLKVMRRESAVPWGLSFNAKRAASAMMTTSTVVTGATAFNSDNIFDDLEVTVIRYPANFIGDAINSRMVTKVPSSVKWKEQVAGGDGRIGAVAEGDTKTLVDYKFEWKYADRKKYAGRIEMTEETEIDFEQLVLDIISMFEEQVLRAYNDGLLTDILAWAPAYAGTALDGTITKPALMNVVSAGSLQLASENYTADVIILNPADYASTQNMQNTNGDPIFVPDTAIFPGLRVFVSNKITYGTVLMGESSLIKEQHSGYILRSGVYGNQFIENEKTIVGEIYSVLKMPIEAKKGWVKLDVATVKTALEPVLA
jgi:hypothetical protein